jgi:hypothetical protein
MHALTRLPAALILTDRIVDDAGLFPPEELDMASALVRHRSDQAISKPVLSQRFVCPAGRFDELHQQLDDGDRIQRSTSEPIDDPRRLGLIADPT